MPSLAAAAAACYPLEIWRDPQVKNVAFAPSSLQSMQRLMREGGSAKSRLGRKDGKMTAQSLREFERAMMSCSL